MSHCRLDGPCPIRLSPVFAALPLEVRARDGCLFRPVELAAGMPLYLEGMPAHSVFGIRSGKCKASQARSCGREQVLRAYGPGDLAGLEALVEDEFAHSVHAVTRVRVCHAPRSQLVEIVASSAPFAQAIAHQFAEELRQERKLLASLGSPASLGRVARLLLDQRGSLGGVLERGGELIELPLDRRDTAALLGMAGESLSRQLTTLERAGVVRRKGRRLVILDVDELTRLAEA